MLSSIAFQNSNDFASVSSKQGETMKSILIAIVTLFSLGSAADIMVVQEETISEQSMKSCEEAKNKILQRLDDYEGVTKIRIRKCNKTGVHNNFRYDINLTLEREVGLLED
tara:strand:- start:1708 stop:2040 length:333 start_codon:yes stop_codon:yes gene_type:complete